MKCQIQWVDGCGKLTPDDNEAVGECWTVDRKHRRFDGTTVTIHGCYPIPICEEHLERLVGLMKSTPYWRYRSYTAEERLARKELEKRLMPDDC